MRNPALRFALLKAGVNWMPARNHAVVAGSPDDEGNSVEVVRGLAQRLPVYWLVSDDPQSLDWLVSDAPAAAQVTCLRKDSLRAYWAYMSARYVFFTHGLYGSPQPPPHKTFVNLWHGDGPKQRKNFITVRSTFVVSGTRLWGSKRGRTFGINQQDVLITGNPRIDQFARPAKEEGLRALDIDPKKPFVLWLPTYRTTEYRGNRIGHPRNWSDATELSNSACVRAKLKEIAEDAQAMGVTLAVKPHHLDADTFTGIGLKIVTGEDLRGARLSLYQLLARAQALITDYSSVWTDYLAVDRPIGFYCPDLDQYTAGRGLNVDDYPGLLPGPMLKTRGDFRAFLHACSEETQASKDWRAESIDRIGAETRLGATERLLDAVGVPLPEEGEPAHATSSRT